MYSADTAEEKWVTQRRRNLWQDWIEVEATDEVHQERASARNDSLQEVGESASFYKVPTLRLLYASSHLAYCTCLPRSTALRQLTLLCVTVSSDIALHQLARL